MADVLIVSGASGGQGQPSGQQPSSRPNLALAAQKLGISEQSLRDALGPPPPNLALAAQKLGISEQVLRNALGLS